MFGDIENAMVNILQRNLEAVPKENIGTRKPDLKIKKNLPAISVANLDFKTDDVGMGRSVSSVDSETVERFSGDGKKIAFALGQKPLRPTVFVEHPAGTRLGEKANYTVDYEKAVVNFHSPPRKGTDNIVIRYRMPVETKGVKFRLNYLINVWSQDAIQRDRITIDVIKALLKEEETFNRKGMLIKPLGGLNIPSDQVPEGVYGKTLEYMVEAYLHVETPLPRIEKIEFKEEKV